MCEFIGGVAIGTMLGVFIMCLVQINRGEEDE